jgi:hypothetical protein
MFTVLFIAAVAVTLAFFDAALRQQFRVLRAAWEQDGSPWGFFSFAREAAFLPGCVAVPLERRCRRRVLVGRRFGDV